MLQLDTNISLVLDSSKDICYLLAMHAQSWSEAIIRYVLAIICAKNMCYRVSRCCLMGKPGPTIWYILAR